MDEEEDKKGLMLFGRDISRIPCFRSSLLNGLGGGIGLGLVTFLFTSRTKMASHVAVTSFVSISIIYWFRCRYYWSLNNFNITQLQQAMSEKKLIKITSFDEAEKSDT